MLCCEGWGRRSVTTFVTLFIWHSSPDTLDTDTRLLYISTHIYTYLHISTHIYTYLQISISSRIVKVAGHCDVVGGMEWRWIGAGGQNISTSCDHSFSKTSEMMELPAPISWLYPLYPLLLWTKKLPSKKLPLVGPSWPAPTHVCVTWRCPFLLDTECYVVCYIDKTMVRTADNVIIVRANIISCNRNDGRHAREVFITKFAIMKCPQKSISTQSLSLWFIGSDGRMKAYFNTSTSGKSIVYVSSFQICG